MKAEKRLLCIRPTRMPLLLAALLVISMLANLLLGLALFHVEQTPTTSPEPRKALACAAIPIRLILEDPACADKLLRVMNVTNVKISSVGTGTRSPEQGTEQVGGGP